MINLINLYNVPKWLLLMKCQGSMFKTYLWLTARSNKLPLSKPINTHQTINVSNWGCSEIGINQNKGDGVTAVRLSSVLFSLLLFCVTAAQPCFAVFRYEKLLKGAWCYIWSPIKHKRTSVLLKSRCPWRTRWTQNSVNDVCDLQPYKSDNH